MDSYVSIMKKIERFRDDNAEYRSLLQTNHLQNVAKEDVLQLYAKLFDIILKEPLKVAAYFKNELLDILSAVIKTNCEKKDLHSHNVHVKYCVVFSTLVQEHSHIKSFIMRYFEKYPAPFERYLDNDSPKRKKLKLAAHLVVNDYDIVNASYLYLKLSTDHFRKQWNWSIFIAKYLHHKDVSVQWLFYQTVAILFGINEKELRILLDKKLTYQASLECALKHLQSAAPTNSISYTAGDTCTSNISEDQVNICGIYLTKAKSDAKGFDLVPVLSTQNNLFKIALGVAANKAICLQGPVGSGKTSLVEYLAYKTGHVVGDNFVKIQLGDQTDSKMLLGTYRCTDVPGEFLWQPGLLTQAVKEGHWILLEDIDSASMDIASVLSGMLENGHLTVPGYKDSIPLHSSFQLFMTQRSITTITGHHRKQTNTTLLLEKHVFQAIVEPLTREELIEVVQTQYPVLRTISNRMVAVFKLFAPTFDDESNGFGAEKLSKSGRAISTRDLFKWCSRSVIGFDVASQSSALKVLQDGIDIFCCSYANVEDRLQLAVEISTHMGIISEKGKYFCVEYKPTVNLTVDRLVVGRGELQRNKDYWTKKIRFCFTRPSACLLERIVCCILHKEPVLLVGETGTGKTSSLQYLANTVGRKLIVINMNQQSDSADLLGGYKPVDMKFVFAPIKRDFEEAFCSFFSVEQNKKFLKNINYCYNEMLWDYLIRLMKKSCMAALQRLDKTPNDKIVVAKWVEIKEKLLKLEAQLKHKSQLAFSFIEGSLVKAIKSGDWVLLDEINLANSETLECLSGLLEGGESSLNLIERGDREPIRRDPNFILFACMNPSTDVGKKDLPAGLRNRFTEFYVEELTDKIDLMLLVNSYLDTLSSNDAKTERIVKFYTTVRKESLTTLTDGLGHRPHFSLRSLCRSLSITARNPCGTFARSLYEAFCLGFLTQLDIKSYRTVEDMIAKYMIGNPKEVKAVLSQPIPQPKGDVYLQFEGYWIPRGSLVPTSPDDYILTQSVRRNLKDIARVVSIGSLPVLLQGDTSVGKTSLIAYLAKSSGNKCVRINNHEHTDLQEYVGSYVADCTGKLVFREGLLVQAMRQGHWIILDELNLAPTDVLEALNRVLDDNRELFVPETQQTIKAHPRFMLFATQNPPGVYGGRKMLSRAFRNRFVELHFNEIPHDELEIILHRRCRMSLSYAKRMIGVMKDLETRRRGSAAFAGKKGFITLRDLFRWGERYRLAQNVTAKLYDWDQHIADEGYLILAGRVRKAEERLEIADVIKKHIKRDVTPDNLFTLSAKTSSVTRHILESIRANEGKHGNIVWTYNMRQLAVMVSKALEYKEPVLLVGETGGGKTTVCQLLAENNQQELVTVNCHMHTESSDFIGGLRPVRDHSDNDLNKLFEWVDGPLIKAMRNGDVFLADEISLADDSVLERLNSLLEPERSLLLAEKGSDGEESIVAKERFNFVGTMNPGGDFGKKELSPALRNRFTEIWCETYTKREDLIAIIAKNLTVGERNDCGERMMDFIEWFRGTETGKRFTVSIRDVLTWVSFVNVCSDRAGFENAYIHGACLTFLDSFGSGPTAMENKEFLSRFREDCIRKLRSQHGHGEFTNEIVIERVANRFGIKPFYVDANAKAASDSQFAFVAPTTAYNTLRLMRGMQLRKAILLEGGPGVGKTSLVMALARATGNDIFRVNLSDQTDISDLFGADLPVEGGVGGQFAWKDGPLLQALKRGNWILLDELNLASQSVLEGLNACLDHRGEIFVPELGKTFLVQKGTKFFGCQNPLKQGGSRRGLPQSFLNRFTQVYVDSLNVDDYRCILTTRFPQIPSGVVEKMIEFNARVNTALDGHAFGHKGGPWEFNLRDLCRWCEVLTYRRRETGDYRPDRCVGLFYVDRMRTRDDREHVRRLYEDVFDCSPTGHDPVPYVDVDRIRFGDVSVPRLTGRCNANVLKQETTALLLRKQFDALRSLIYNVNLKWMSVIVGGSGCGKSSLVKTLAQLCGKRLKVVPVTSSMDTADLLGGFEQTDYTRHVEEIVKEIERVVLDTCQERLLASAGDALVDATRKWEETRDFLRRESDARTMQEETRLFVEKLERLRDFVARLNRDDAAIAALSSELRRVAECVESDGSLNAGGKFEWVDSVLVKCLRDGDWLLVDNVNLCSPAVLDRLNALLEPGGVLTISERGVDRDGNMVEVVPHPDFRLFLTMDPANGEISRAMRNRGVEIYVLDDDSATPSDYDTKSVIANAELRDRRLIDSLIAIDRFVAGMTHGDRAATNRMVQAAFLIAQQTARGVRPKDAFVRATLEIYYKTRSPHEFDVAQPKSVILEEIDRLFADDVGDNFASDVTLRVVDLQTDSALARVRQQAVTAIANRDGPLFRYFLLHYYTIANADDLMLRTALLKRSLNESSATLETLDALTRGWLMLSPTKDDVPAADPRWLSIEADGTYANRLFLMLYHQAVKCLDEPHADYRAKRGDKQFTILRYAHAVDAGLIDCKMDDVAVSRVARLLDAFDSNIIQSAWRPIDDATLIDALSLLTWRYAVYDYMRDNRIDGKPLKRTLDNFHLHYKWFVKKSVRRMNEAVPSISADGDIEEIVNESMAQLANHFSPVKRLAKRYRRAINGPPPLINAAQLRTSSAAASVFAKYTLHDISCDFAATVSEYVLRDAKLRDHLIALKLAMDYEYETEPDVAAIEAYAPSLKRANRADVNLLPLYDYVAILQLTSMQNSPNNRVDTAVTVPPVLIALIDRFDKTRDARLVSELSGAVCDYKMHAACLNAEPYFTYDSSEAIAEEDAEQRDVCRRLTLHSPTLTYLTCRLLLDDNGDRLKPTLYGNYRDSAAFHRKVKAIIWQNATQLTDERFDFARNETVRLTRELREFAIDLCETLNVDCADCDVGVIFENCRRKLESTIEDDQRRIFVDVLRDISAESVKLLNDTDDRLSRLKTIANLYILLNLFKSLLNSQLPPIDRLVKLTFKKRYANRELDNFKRLLRSFELQNEVYSNSANNLHPLCESVKRKIAEIDGRIANFDKYVAVRPESVNYSSVVAAINHGFSTVLSGEKILNVYKTNNVQDAQTIEISLASFVDTLKRFRHHYPDVIEPLLCNVIGLLYGIKLKISASKKLDDRTAERIVDLIRFPHNHKLDAECDAKETQNLIETVLTRGDEAEVQTEKYNYRLLLCGIQEIYNVCVVDSHQTARRLDRALFESFDRLLKTFVRSWKRQEEERELKRKEEENLYKTKTKCATTEDEEIENDFKRLFPSYHDRDFGDIQNTVLADDDDDVEDSEVEVDDGYKDLITQEDVRFVTDLHAKFVRNGTRCEWINGPGNRSLPIDFVKPLMARYGLFKRLLEKTVDGLWYQTDGEAIGSLNVLAAIAQCYGRTNCFDDAIASPSRHADKKRYDFYKDPNVDEVKSSYHLLEELRVKIAQLLNEWPEHPNLQTIKLIIARVYAFELTSPLSRYLAAFEILLGKCNDWEVNAHSGVSLQQHLAALTQQIIAWRKLELNIWKNSLNHAFERMNEPMTKWWFHLYNAIDDFVNDTESTTERDFVATVKQFVLQSNLAEYENRLNLLYTFHCHLINVPKTARTTSAINALWNVYHYYNQFVSTVRDKIKELLAPIEKKLKDYVKIVRWKDISYWAIKETLTKTHRTLHKHVREYEDVLRQPVLPHLGNVTSKSLDTIGIWDRPKRQSPKKYHYTMDSSMYMAKQSHQKMLQEETHEKFFKKSRKLCKNAINKTEYPKLIKSIDTFVTDVIESIQHYQRLEVDRTLPKNKQKSQAKSFLQQKQRGLTDLFKSLQTMGLSFKSGLVESKSRDDCKWFLLKPIDLEASFSYLNYCRNDEKMLTIWEGCETYYTRSLIRMDILEESLKHPSKELNVQTIERCKGFTVHLTNLIHQLKSELIETTRNLYYLRYYHQCFNEICTDSDFIGKSLSAKVRSVLKAVTITMQQYKIFLQSIPEAPQFDDDESVADVPVLKPTRSTIKYKNDDAWSETVSTIGTIRASVQKIIGQLDKTKFELPSIERNLIDGFDRVPVGNLKATADEIRAVAQRIDRIRSIVGDDLPLTAPLKSLAGELLTIAEELEKSETREVATDLDGIRIQNKVVRLSNAILISIQTIYKKYAVEGVEVSNVGEPVGNGDGDDDSEIEMKENHLRIRILENLRDDFVKLNVDHVVKRAKSLSKCKAIDAQKSHLTACVPLLEQICLLYEYFVTQQVSAYRAATKLNSILLNLFIDLAKKGFCTPEDLSDETSEEGDGQQSGGMGLGEGQGEKDVSDRIESEDQLEDARPAEEEDQEPGDCKEEDKGIEMSEDFDGKLQDVERKDEDEEESNDDSDADEQMGETEKGADQLDQQVWGSDEEEADDDDEQEEGKGEEKGNKGEKEGEKEMAAKEDEAAAGDDDNEDGDNGDDKRDKRKDEINEMQEPEYDDEQIDPYHGKQPELPEPEPMDLPEDMQIDDNGDEKEENNDEENPFDVDNMKKDQLPQEMPDEEEKKPTEQENPDEDGDQSESESDDERRPETNEQETDAQEQQEEDATNASAKENETERAGEDEDDQEKPEEAKDDAQTGLDQSQTQQEAESMDVDDSVRCADNVEPQADEKTRGTERSNRDIAEEEHSDKDGVGRSQMEESETGHRGRAEMHRESRDANRHETDEQRKRPGDADVERSLGDANEPVKKKLKATKAIDSERPEQEDEEEGVSEENRADGYRHVKEAKSADEQILDTATKEQAETQKDVLQLTEKDNEDEELESTENLPIEEEADEGAMQEDAQKPEKLRNDEKKTSKKLPQHPEGDILEEINEMQVDGDRVDTMTVERGAETTYHTHYDVLNDNISRRMTMQEIASIRRDVERQLSTWTEAPSSDDAEKAWTKISSMTLSLAQDLSEQLRLVLEPTRASRLKGDFRTGRRINMRKVIPYIASQFRKDKIWLRRTRPSKREYQIAIAIDDSSSMADNHSKELAFESVSLISKALSLLESGQLAVLRYGETTDVLHKLDDCFTDRTGAKLLQTFTFEQQKTCVGRLMDFANEMLTNAGSSQSNSPNAKLLIIIGDGRGIFSEGESYVRQAARRAKLANVFMIFVIVDNPLNKNSILDIRVPIFKDGNVMEIRPYLDTFPFPFYIVLRDINSLPSVLSDALRQWFEIVTNLDRQ